MLNFGVSEAATKPLRPWPSDELRSVAPRTHTLLSTNNPAEIALALELHGRFGTLDFAEQDGGNPWGLRYATLFHSSGAKEKGLLLRGHALEADGFTLGRDKRYRRFDGRVAVPVYEGQMANRWDHRARTFEGFTGKDRYGRKPHIPWVTDAQHADPDFEVEPRYWMYEKVAQKRMHEVVPEGHSVMAMRDIGAVWTNRRSLRVAVMEPLPATHTLPVLVAPAGKVLAIATLLNSMTLDFLVRLHMPGGHVTPWVLSQCAVPPPSEIAAECCKGGDKADHHLKATRGVRSVKNSLLGSGKARAHGCACRCGRRTGIRSEQGRLRDRARSLRAAWQESRRGSSVSTAASVSA